MYYLAGDIGGTKALLGIAVTNDVKGFNIIHQQRYECHEFSSLEAIIEKFLSSLDISRERILHCCMGLPGPVSSRVVELTNLPWVVDANRIEKVCQLKKVDFVNDFYAAALGIEVINADSLKPLYSVAGKTNFKGNRLVVGAGTGLGVAPIYFDAGQFHPQPSEGGHFDFAPISETQQLLLNWCWTKWQHVSYERFLSGAGLELLYEFFQLYDIDTTFAQPNSNNLNKNKGISDKNSDVGLFIAKELNVQQLKRPTAPEIKQLAEQKDPVAEKALQEFVTIYGAFIGASALLWSAPGGVFIAGGIAEKIMKWMQYPCFKQAYLEKGRMTKLVEQTPVYVVTDSNIGLKGAAQYCSANAI